MGRLGVEGVCQPIPGHCGGIGVDVVLGCSLLEMHALHCRACGCVQSQQTRCCGWRREFRAPQRQSVAVRRGISTAVCLPGGGLSGGLLHSSQITRWSINTSYQLPVPPCSSQMLDASPFQGSSRNFTRRNQRTNEPNQTNQHNPSHRGLNLCSSTTNGQHLPFLPAGGTEHGEHSHDTTRDSSGYELDIKPPSTTTKPSAFRNSHWHGSRAAANPSPASPA